MASQAPVLVSFFFAAGFRGSGFGVSGLGFTVRGLGVGAWNRMPSPETLS